MPDKKINLDGRSFINGERVGEGDDEFPSINPATGALLAPITNTSISLVDAAIACAKESFLRHDWSQQSAAYRGRLLKAIANILSQHKEELAMLECLDNGKPITDCLTVDVPNCIDTFRWYGEVVDKMPGEIANTDSQATVLVEQAPIGVVAAILPWNYPLVLAAWKIAPALAAGNSVIIKPSEYASLSVLRLAELLIEAGLPKGVLHVVPGTEQVGKYLSLSHDIDVIAFSGSTSVGKQILTAAGRSNMKRVYLECGGKSPNIVFSSCQDLNKAAKYAADAIFFNQGQNCIAGSRLLVETSIKDEFIPLLLQHSQYYQANNPLDPNTTLGAINNEQHFKKLLEVIEQAGADSKLVTGGHSTMDHTGGYFLVPTIFTDVDNSSFIAQEELFGPILSIIDFSGEDKAIELANDSKYGLSAGIWSDDFQLARHVARQVQSGYVWINTYGNEAHTTPVGGYKLSGIGRDLSAHSLKNYSESKTTWIA